MKKKNRKCYIRCVAYVTDREIKKNKIIFLNFFIYHSVVLSFYFKTDEVGTFLRRGFGSSVEPLCVIYQK